MIWVDWVIVSVIVLSMLLAAAQGFFFELFSLAGVVAGYLLAAWLYGRVAAFYAPLVQSGWVANLAGFLTIFLAVVVLAGVVARLARWAMREVGLRWIDRTLGAAFGVVRGILLVTVVLLAQASFAPTSNLVARSQIAPYLLVLARAASWAAPEAVRAQFRQGIAALRQLRAMEGPADRAPKAPPK